MKIAGIICEYNPFHNGHERHIRLTRERTGCDWVICAMAGALTQRGELAIADKFARARMALSCGADAVFELPALYAARTADVFAAGGVWLLHALGARALSFGSEIADIEAIEALARLREREPEALSVAVKEGLRAGKSHARARGEALHAHGEPMSVGAGIGLPNMILAVEYARAAARLAPGMRLVPVPREGSYHDDALVPLASATAIRGALREGRDVSVAMPPRALEILKSAPLAGALDELILFKAREANAALVGAGEGLENRLAACARTASSREELLRMVKCKRYTRARISRLIAAALTGMTQALAHAHPLPEYARLLGFRASARPLISYIAGASALPVITRPSELKGHAVFELERRATDAWALSTPARAADRDLTEKLIVLP